jgi:signal transduction histidine kinase
MGLANLRSRAASIGAELEIASLAGEGTTVRVSLPL